MEGSNGELEVVDFEERKRGGGGGGGGGLFEELAWLGRVLELRGGG